MSTYVVFALTVTWRVPVAETEPTPLLMLTFVAFSVAQVSVATAPRFTDVGDTLNAVHFGTTGTGATMTGALQVTVFVPSVAVSLNVVLIPTYTLFEPSTETEPTPLSILTPVAFVVAQVSVVVPAVVKVPGDAVNASHVTGGN